MVDNAIHRINHYPLDTANGFPIFIHWIVIYLAPVAQKLDSDIQLINHYPANNAIVFRNTYPLDSEFIRWIALSSFRETNCTIHCIEIYAVDSTIHLLNNWGQALDVQTLDSAIHGINHCPADKY